MFSFDGHKHRADIRKNLNPLMKKVRHDELFVSDGFVKLRLVGFLAVAEIHYQIGSAVALNLSCFWTHTQCASSLHALLEQEACIYSNE